MKVRWNQNSLRLRITPSELAALKQSEPVTETLAFPNGAVWSVQLAFSAVTNLTSETTAARLTLSSEDLLILTSPDTEGVYFQTENGLRFWVEKDFPCAHPRAAEAAEPATETFDAPAGFEERKAQA